MGGIWTGSTTMVPLGEPYKFELQLEPKGTDKQGQLKTKYPE